MIVRQYGSQRMGAASGCATALATTSASRRRAGAANAFVIIFAMMPLVDSFNGMLIKSGFSGSLTVGDAYRLVVIFLMAAYFFRGARKVYFLAMSLTLALGFCSMLAHAVDGSPASVVAEINLLVQWAFAPFLTFAMYTAVLRGDIDGNSPDAVLNALQWLAPLTILVPYVLGLGYSTYHTADDSLVGYKAFYYATNGISLMLIALFTRSVYGVFKTKKPMGLLLMLINGGALALIGTKSSLVMLALAFFIALFCLYGNRFLKFLARAIPVACVIALAFLVVSQLFSDYFAPIWDRTQYFFAKVYGGNFVSFLTTGRVDQIAVHWIHMLSLDHTWLAVLFGEGDLSSIMKICEMDYFDAFFQFGLCGFVLLLVFVVHVLGKGYASGGLRRFEFCMTVFFLIYALVVGHVFTNAMSCMVVSLFFVLSMHDRSSGVGLLCALFEKKGKNRK